MTSAYDILASEYYDASHQTSRNFDEATRTAIAELGWRAPEGLVLDAGCGRGRVGEYLGVHPARVIQLDSSEQMLRLDPREASIVRVLHTAETLPFIADQFRCVAAFLSDPFLGIRFVAEARRVLVAGGILYITTPSASWGTELRSSLGLDFATTRFKLRTGAEARVPSHLYDPAELRELAISAGFDTNDVVVNEHCVPEGTTTLSPDIVTVAERRSVSAFDVPVLVTMECAK